MSSALALSPLTRGTVVSSNLTADSLAVGLRWVGRWVGRRAQRDAERGRDLDGDDP
jgi:hypothetical protein